MRRATTAHNKSSVAGLILTNNRRKPAGREHQLTGHFNPRCVRCRRPLIWITANPDVACAATPLPLPFDLIETVLPHKKRRSA